jgi:dTDP-4-amino-4,6-dideoxygalactose transaminase
MNLQLVDLTNQYRKIKPEIDEAVHSVLDSGQFVLGKFVSEFEQNTAKYLGIKHAIGCASGTDALQVALMALGIGPGDEVITTSFTFVATVETIALIGAKPVYVDIESDTFNIDSAKIEAAITKNTKAIIPVHLYGHSADMDPIIKIAKKHNLKIIEDTAQTMGAEYLSRGIEENDSDADNERKYPTGKWRKVGTIGDIGCISFFPSKNLGAYGDAGMCVTNDDTLADKLRMIIVHGSKIRYHHELLGVNSRLDSLQAAILNVKLKYLDEWNSERLRAAKFYNKLFEGTAATTPKTAPYSNHIFHQYTLRVPRRDGLTNYLKSKNIPFGIYYPIPLHRQKAYLHFTPMDLNLPVTEQMTKEVISLPMHTELTDEMQKYIADEVKSFLCQKL